MLQVPIIVSGLVLLVFAVVDWRRAPLLARVSLGAATAFALAALRQPGVGVEEFLRTSNDGLTYVVALARVAGVASVLISLTLTLRNSLGMR